MVGFSETSKPQPRSSTTTRGGPETRALLGTDETTVQALAAAADEVDTPKGRRLVGALAGPNNRLREEFRNVFGRERM